MQSIPRKFVKLGIVYDNLESRMHMSKLFNFGILPLNRCSINKLINHATCTKNDNIILPMSLIFPIINTNEIDSALEEEKCI
jgi:hypothetical protein